MKDETQFDKLHRAITEGNEDVIKAAVAERFDVNSKDYHGRTLLMFAADEGKKHLVETLISAGAKLDVRDQMNFHDGGGKTALHRAVANRHAEVVSILIAAGAKVDVADKNQGTALELAVNNNDLLMVETLLKAGANPNGSGKTMTPLSTAVALKLDGAVRLLLTYRADPNHSADARYPVLSSAAFWGLPEICRMLIEAGANVNAKDSDSMTALEGINKTVDPSAWKALQAEEVEILKQAVHKREEIKAMLNEAVQRQRLRFAGQREDDPVQ